MRGQSVFLVVSLALSVAAVPVPSLKGIARDILPGILAPRVAAPYPSVEQSHAVRSDINAIPERREPELIRADVTVDRRQDAEFENDGNSLGRRQGAEFENDGNSLGRRQGAEFENDGNSLGRRQGAEFENDGNSLGR